MGRSALRYGLVICMTAVLWKLASVALGGIILPAPEDAGRAFFEALFTPVFWVHFSVSAYRCVAAMVLAWVVAFPLGLIMGSVKRVDDLLARSSS